MSAGVQSELLERQGETAAFARALDAAATGAGAALSIEGPAGIGKTALLAEAAAGARAAGFTVVGATASELEAAYGFGVARQVFSSLPPERRDAALDGTSDAAAAALGAVDPAALRDVDQLPAAVHGLFWLTANLARGGPIAICVDDLHWADAASARWVDYLARRIDGLAAVIVATLRTDEPHGRQRPGDQGWTTLAPAALSPAAAGALIARRVRQPVGERFAEASCRATGGNPLLLEQLAEAIAVNGWEPSDDAVARLEEFGPPQTEALALRRLKTLGPAATAVARAVAVLGSTATPELVAALAGMDDQEAANAADLLVEAAIFDAEETLAFVHPVVAAATRASIPPHRRALMHRQVASLLLDRGASPARVAPHLLHCEPDDDPVVVEVLRAAAADALARGTTDAAARALARAYAEPPRPDVVAAVALELGRCETALGDPAGAVHLREAMDAAPTPRERAAAALALGPVLVMANQVEQSVAVLEAALADLGDEAPELRLEIETELLSSTHLNLTEHKRWSRRVAEEIGRGDAFPPALRRISLGHVAQHAAFQGRDPEEVRAIAREAIADGILLAELGSGTPAYYFAVSALVLAEEFAEARDGFTAALDDAGRRGSPTGFAFASCFRALPNLRLGDLDAAEADSRASLAVAEEHGIPLAVPGGVIWLVEALVERGRLDDAQQTLDRYGMNGTLPPHTWFQHLYEKRGRLRIGQGRLEDAVADLYEVGRRTRAVGNSSIAEAFWRSEAAPALLALGREDEARRLANEQLDAARSFGGRHAISRSLLGVAATMPDGDDALAALAEARTLGREAGTPIAQARAAVAEGSMLRRLGRRADAREALREGVDLARRCGATALAAQAQEELLASGARPRRVAERGPEALTPSELRIARLAARGQSNTSIARSLFVTEKTVETHLTSVYKKLGIASRRELPTGLPEPDEL